MTEAKTTVKNAKCEMISFVRMQRLCALVGLLLYLDCSHVFFIRVILITKCQGYCFTSHHSIEDDFRCSDIRSGTWSNVQCKLEREPLKRERAAWRQTGWNVFSLVFWGDFQDPKRLGTTRNEKESKTCGVNTNS